MAALAGAGIIGSHLAAQKVRIDMRPAYCVPNLFAGLVSTRESELERDFNRAMRFSHIEYDFKKYMDEIQ